MRVLAIVPAFNEEQSLPAVVAEVVAAGYDVAVINDASIDRTERVARAAGVRVISLSNNLGIGGAVQAGFLFAARNASTTSWYRLMATVSMTHFKSQRFWLLSSPAKRTASWDRDTTRPTPIWTIERQFSVGWG